MTIVSSGPISIQAIQAEFGGPASNIVLQNYYAGGSYVAAGTLNGSGVAIPSSGAIKLQDFYGASAVIFPVNGVNLTQSRGNVPTGTTTCFINLQSAGTISNGSSGGTTSSHYTGPTSWVTPNSAASSYQIIVDSVSNSGGGSASASVSTGTWSSPGVNFSASCGPGQSITSTFNCRIRSSSSLVVVASFSINLNLDNT